MTDEPVPYREVSEPEYAQQAAETFEIEDYGTGLFLLGGPCPRCLAPIEVPVIGRIVRAIRLRRVYEQRHDAQTVPVICTCAEAHPGRPEERVGCGAYWTFELPADR